MNTTDPNTPPYPGFDDLLAELLSRQDVGEAIDRDRLLQQHPEFAEELLAFLDDLALIDRVRGPATRTHPANDASSPVTLPTRFGDYMLLEEIARGGMGVVYKARQTRANRLVALKMVRERLVDTPDRLRRFRSEVDAVAVLDHPNIVPLYEVGEHNGQPYFSMKLIEGGSLAAAVAGGQWPVASQEAQGRAAELIATVARAVHYAHQRGILHRDLKPGNILLGSSIDDCRLTIGTNTEGTPPAQSSIDNRQSSIPYVTDFGLARRLDDDSHLTATGSVVGTPAYMAPEQALGRRDLSVAVDVYALGAILYEMLTGRPPFTGDSTVETILQVRDQEPTRPGSVVRGLPRDLEIICLKCLRKEAQERYGSALALAEDLERWLAGEPISARPVGSLRRAWKWSRRNPALAGLLAACLLLLVGGFVGVLSQWRRAEARERDTRDALDEAHRNLDRAERHLYYQRIALADREWLNNRADLAAQLLDDCPPEWRDWEWRYLRRRGREGVKSLPGHGPDVRAVAYHPGGNLLAAAGSNRRLKVWDLSTGTCLHTLGPFPSLIGDVAISPDGKLMAVNAKGNGVRLWDLLDGGRELRERGSLGENLGGGRVTFSHDGRWIAASGTAGKTMAVVWEVATCREVVILPSPPSDLNQAVTAFQPNSTRLAVAASNRLRLIDLTGAMVSETTLDVEDTIADVAWHPNGKELALATGLSVVVLEVNPPAPPRIRRRLLGHAAAVRGVSYRPDGKELVSVSEDGTARVWDSILLHHPRTIQGQAGQLRDAAWHPQGTHLALAGGNGIVKVWDLAHAGPGRVVEIEIQIVMDLAFRGDGRQLMVVRPGRDLRLRPWPADEQGVFEVKLGKSSRAAYRPDGRQLALATGDGRVEFRDPDSNRVRTEIRVPMRSRAAGGTLRVAYSPDGRVLATSDLPRSEESEEAFDRRWPADVQLWRADEEGWNYAPFARLTGATVWADALAFSPDGRWFVACGQDSMVHVWDLTRLGADGILAPTWTSNPGGRTLRCLAFTPRGSLFATGGADGVVRLWDVESGEERGRLKGHTGLVSALAFTPDGRRLASAGFDGLIRVWDVTNRHELLTLAGHDGRVLTLAFSPDGHVLVSGGDDGAVRAWDGSP